MVQSSLTFVERSIIIISPGWKINIYSKSFDDVTRGGATLRHDRQRMKHDGESQPIAISHLSDSFDLKSFINFSYMLCLCKCVKFKFLRKASWIAMKLVIADLSTVDFLLLFLFFCLVGIHRHLLKIIESFNNSKHKKEHIGNNIPYQQ